jgi:uncharacterized protein DUF6265
MAMSLSRRSWGRVAVYAVTACALAMHFSAYAQAPAAEPAKDAAGSSDLMTLSALAWLEGCWRGSVNQREFREQWLPLRGGMMIGSGHNVMQDKTQDYEYLRLESRPDGVYYIALPSGKKESPFRLATATTEDKDTLWTFVSATDEFPQRIVYRRGTEGWLYATIEGKLNGEERKVIFPMRRINCETGDFIRK